MDHSLSDGTPSPTSPIEYTIHEYSGSIKNNDFEVTRRRLRIAAFIPLPPAPEGFFWASPPDGNALISIVLVSEYYNNSWSENEFACMDRHGDIHWEKAVLEPFDEYRLAHFQ